MLARNNSRGMASHKGPMTRRPQSPHYTVAQLSMKQEILPPDDTIMDQSTLPRMNHRAEVSQRYETMQRLPNLRPNGSISVAGGSSFAAAAPPTTLQYGTCAKHTIKPLG